MVQLFHELNSGHAEPILGVVGQLQFEVIQFRLQAEYGVETMLDRMPYGFARWIVATPEALREIHWVSGTRRVEDESGNLVCLFESEWGLNYMVANNPAVEFRETDPQTVGDDV